MTPNYRYTTGRVSVQADGGVVNFSSALLLQTAMAGDHISIDRRPSVEVLSVNTDLQLGIEPWNGPSLSGVDYVLYLDSILRATRGQVAAATAKLAKALNSSSYYYYVPEGQDAPDPSDGDEGQWAQQESSGKRWRKIGGVWIDKGVYAVFSLQGDWAAATPYAQSVVVNRAGKLWQSRVDDNLSHPPETSPTQWRLFLAGGDAYDIAEFDTDRPASAEVVLDFCVTRKITFYSGMTESRARARVGATSIAYYKFLKNGVEFARMTFAAAGQTGPQQAVFTCATDTTLDPASNDVLTIVAPAVRDETLSGIAWTIAAYRL